MGSEEEFEFGEAGHGNSHWVDPSNKSPAIFKFLTQNEFELDQFKPVWIGHGWKYCGKVYPSLRILKTRSDYKFHNRLSKIAADEIRKEIDNELLKEIRDLAKFNEEMMGTFDCEIERL